MSEYNLLSLIHLLSTGKPYKVRSTHVSDGGVPTIEELPEEEEEEEGKEGRKEEGREVMGRDVCVHMFPCVCVLYVHVCVHVC